MITIIISRELKFSLSNLGKGTGYQTEIHSDIHRNPINISLAIHNLYIKFETIISRYKLNRHKVLNRKEKNQDVTCGQKCATGFLFWCYLVSVFCSLSVCLQCIRIDVKRLSKYLHVWHINLDVLQVLPSTLDWWLKLTIVELCEILSGVY